MYASAETVPFDEVALDNLLELSRKNNEANNWTGMLLYRDGDFLQVLEGEEDVVKKVCQKIYKDNRHTGVLELDKSEIDVRDFGQWSMGFRRLKKEDIPAGFVNFFDRSFDEEDLCTRGSEALDFLSSFKELGNL